MALTFAQGHNFVSNLRKSFRLYFNGNIYRKYLSYGIHTWRECRLMHGIYIPIVVSMTLTLTQGHSGSAEDQIQLSVISTTKKAIQIKLAATVCHDTSYFSLKSSVLVVLNHGHTNVSCKTCVRSLVCPCLIFRAFGVQSNDVILPSRLRVS